MHEGRSRRIVALWRWAMWTALMTVNRAADGGTIMGLCAREPTVRVDCYPPVDNFPNVTEEACLAQGCCWKPLNNSGIPCAFDALGRPDDAKCAKVPDAFRVECRNPRFAVKDVLQDEATCHSIGCCFDDNGVCFQPFYEGYELLMLEETDDGWRGTLVLRRFRRGPFGNDVSLLQLHVIKESPSRVRIRITDPSFPRYEVPGVPIRVDREEQVGGSSYDDEDMASDYRVHFYERPFGVAVTRRHSGELLFNSTPDIHASSSFNGLVFENQYLEISTSLERHDAVGSPVLYGLGERWGEARLRADRKGDHYPLFSRRARKISAHERDGGDNLGGVHPFYLQVLDSGRAHGVLFHSSNAMEVVTQHNALTFRTMGGVLDIFVFTGPSPLDATSEYTKVVGRPELPPVWALGYHYGKRGVKTLEESMVEVAKLREAGVPMDAYWQDVDYMYGSEPFTLDEANFPLKETQAFVDDLHFNNQYYVVLVTPAIPTEPMSPDSDHAAVVVGEDGIECTSGSGSAEAELVSPGSTIYYPLERGKLMDVFVRGVHGERYAEKRVGSQWAAFIDFFHPNSTTYWREMLQSFHEQVLPFDGVWIDNNEPAVTCDEAFSGVNHSCETTRSDGSLQEHPIGVHSGDDLAEDPVGTGEFVRSLDVGFPFDPYRQPFVPGQSSQARGGHGNLNAATLPMASLHTTSIHYNVHSLYGHEQAKRTRYALDRVLRRRSLSLSRSTYSGDGQYGGHLFGDVTPTWENLHFSVSAVIQMNILGIHLCGVGVGGNGVGIDKELSIRWNQAASFFPLFHNHASKDAKPQSPIDFDQETANIVRELTLRRYRHLPYFYTQFYHAHVHGIPVVRGLGLEFSQDPLAFDVETQYMVGPALMVSPVVEQHAISKRTYFPNATWYDLENGREVITTTDPYEDYKERFVQLLAPLHVLQIHIRGGHIVATQQASSTIAMTKRGIYRLIVALDPALEHPAAEGELFIDDGDSLYSVHDERYSLISFKAHLREQNRLVVTSKRLFYGYDGPEMNVDIEEIVVFGLRGDFLANSSLHLHGESKHSNVKADYFEQANMLVISRVMLPVGDEIDLSVESRTPQLNEDEGIDQSRPGEIGSSAGGSVGSEDEDSNDGDGAAEAHGGRLPDDKKGSRQEEENKPSPITGEQKGSKKKGMTTIGIIGIIAGVIFVAGILMIVVQRRRRGYNPIA